MAKGWKITISIISIVLILILVTLLVYYFFPWHKKFFNNADEEFSIPGLDEKFVPQGMTELEGYNKYLVSGYMSDGEPSRYYLIDAETNNIEKYVILNINGKKYNGHAGGVASYGSTIWTTSEEDGKGYAFRFLANDLISADNGSEVVIRDYFETYNNADFVFVNNDTLWVGEFYRKDKFETDQDHHLETRSGEANTGLIYGFDIDESKKCAVSNTFPSKVISVRAQCQGVAVTDDGNFILSTSYSISDSVIYYYEDILSEEAHGTYRLGLDNIPLWYIDNDALIKSTKIPSMSEEILVKNDRVYILFESACKKYKLFNRTRISSVYSVPVSYFDK